MSDPIETIKAAAQAESRAREVLAKARHMVEKIACPFCGCRTSLVVKPRMHRNGRTLIRRRECQNPDCRKRFNTAERVCA